MVMNNNNNNNNYSINPNQLFFYKFLTPAEICLDRIYIQYIYICLSFRRIYPDGKLMKTNFHVQQKRK